MDESMIGWPPTAASDGQAADSAGGAGVPAPLRGGASRRHVALNLAIDAWLHAKKARSQSERTKTAHAATLTGFRALLQSAGLDLIR